MDTEEIFDAMDRLAAAMVEKGIPKPKAEIEIRDGRRIQVNLWGDGIGRDGLDNLWVYMAETPEDGISKAEKHIAELPTTEERNTRMFQSKLAETIDLGNQLGIDVKFLNPIVETARELAENALTYQEVS